LNSELARRYRETAEMRAMASLSRRAEEISEWQEFSNQEKIRRLKELLEEAAAMEIREEERPRAVMFSRFAANEAARKLIEESKKMNLERDLMVRVGKFKFNLKRLLEAEGLMPKAEAEFGLGKNPTTIDGKKLPQAVHERIKQMCRETIGKKFDSDTKIVLQLNSER
jgi:hypothetical protein